ncbi:MAG: hypothetical protein QF792_06915 [Phycisphaerae bacterium]|nr:hypothetical protein [Phycisphaerae bacterium]
MTFRPATMRWIWLAAAGGLLAGATRFQGPLDDLGRRYELVAPGTAVQEEHPELALLTVVPGGLRPILVSYFWIRSQELHQAGRHYDAMQLAETICNLQPRFPSVWAFQAWQMAWNISVETHTPQERWHWVSRGIELLRDKAIPLNPTALLLYKELSWIFLSKMGDRTDEMHIVYKQRWAHLMQELLGAAAYEEAEAVLAAFKQIADAPLDTDPLRKGRHVIQGDQLELLLAGDPPVAKKLRKNAEFGVRIDRSLLEAYNRYTLDDAVAITRAWPLRIADERGRRLAELINDAAYSKARGKLLSFIRGQILWNKYKMDPRYMYKLMEDYGPIDWRGVWAHSLYWSAYGTDHCTDSTRKEIDWLNTDRTRLNSLKSMVWFGRMTYVQNPREPGAPLIALRSDWRFLKAGHEEYVRLAGALAEARDQAFDENMLGGGHINYLSNAIVMLFNRGQYRQGAEYLKWIKDNYHKTGDRWDIDDVEEFVFYELREDQAPNPQMAVNQITTALQMAFVSLAAGDEVNFERKLAYAFRANLAYHSKSARRTERLRLPSMEVFAAGVLGELLVRPRLVGFNITLENRSALYGVLSRRFPQAVLGAYDRIRIPLGRQCRVYGLDFAKAFPAPRGLAEWRSRLRRDLEPLRR